MTTTFAIGAPELAGFSVLGATAGAALSSWLVPAADVHAAAGCIAGAVALPIICALPQWIAASSRLAGRLMARLPRSTHLAMDANS